jgi:hypothetical protein
MDHIIRAIDACVHTKGGRTTNLTSNGACKRNWDNLANNKNLKQVTIPINFVTNIQVIKHKTIIILTLEMAQTFRTFKSQTKRIFNVGSFHLAPNVPIVPSVRALDLFGKPHWLVDLGESQTKCLHQT